MVTSIFPSYDRRQIDNQVKAVSSWREAGFSVISCNIREEIDKLSHIFDYVEFVEMPRSGLMNFGKPYIYISDLIALMKSKCNGVFGIINSDIRLRNLTDSMIKNIRHEAENKLLFLHRYDIIDEDDINGEYYFTGMDAFFLHTQNAEYFFDEGFVMGQAEWDHCMIYRAIKSGISAVEIKNPIAYHLKHEQRWKAEQCSELIKCNADEYYSVVNEVLSNTNGISLTESKEEDLFSVISFEGVYIDDKALQFLKNHARKNNYSAVRSDVGLGYYRNSEFHRVCMLHGQLKKLYADACIIRYKTSGNYEYEESGIIAAYVDFEKTEVRKKLYNKKIILYPAGKGARMMLDCFEATDLKPIGFADKNSALLDNTCGGYNVFAQKDLITLEYDYIVVVSNLYTEEILAELTNIGIKQEKIIVI